MLDELANQWATLVHSEANRAPDADLQRQLDDARRERDEMVAVLKKAADREWKDETPLQVATIVANGLYWRAPDYEEVKQRAESAEAANQKLRRALGMLYDKWENGDPCYEDADENAGFMGNAFRLSAQEEDEVLALLGPQHGDTK
jgi:hypothetical protein